MAPRVVPIGGTHPLANRMEPVDHRPPVGVRTGGRVLLLGRMARMPGPVAPQHSPPDSATRFRGSFPDGTVWDAPGQASATSNAVMFRVSLLNSTPTRWIGSPRLRYFAA